MGGVEITSDDKASSLVLKRVGIAEKVAVKIELVLQPLIIFLAVGEIDVEQYETSVVKLDHPPFGIESFNSETTAIRQRPFPRIDRQKDW